MLVVLLQDLLDLLLVRIAHPQGQLHGLTDLLALLRETTNEYIAGCIF